MFCVVHGKQIQTLMKFLNISNSWYDSAAFKNMEHNQCLEMSVSNHSKTQAKINSALKLCGIY